MILQITNDSGNKTMDGRTYIISKDALHLNGVHLFIASNKWDELQVDLSDDMPLDVFKFMVGVCSKVSVTLPPTITDKTVKLLVELYPEKSGTIRKAYMSGGNIKELLQ